MKVPYVPIWTVRKGCLCKNNQSVDLRRLAKHLNNQEIENINEVKKGFEWKNNDT